MCILYHISVNSQNWGEGGLMGEIITPKLIFTGLTGLFETEGY